MASVKHVKDILLDREIWLKWKKKVLPRNCVYAGRANTNYDLPTSIFCNPFRMPDKSEAARLQVIAAYKNWFITGDATNADSRLLKVFGFKNFDEWRERLRGLLQAIIDSPSSRKVTFLCWCAPDACHCDFLAEMINEKKLQ